MQATLRNTVNSASPRGYYAVYDQPPEATGLPGATRVYVGPYQDLARAKEDDQGFDCPGFVGWHTHAH